MKPAPLSYVAVPSVQDALSELALRDDSKVIAGGQSLLPLLALRMASPSRLVDVNKIADLDCVFEDAGDVVLGSLVRHRRLVEDRAVAVLLPLLPMAASHIGHVAIRNRGTLGGSVAHADPAAELCAVMKLLDARMTCASAERGTRDVPAEEFFLGPYATALDDDELLTSVRVPVPSPGVRAGFVEFSARTGDYARAGAACQVLVRESRVEDAQAVVFGVGVDAVRLPGPPAGLIGETAEAVDWEELAFAWVRETSERFSPPRRSLVGTALARSLTAAVLPCDPSTLEPSCAKT